MSKPSNRSYFLIGMGIGAWLNIWPAVITHVYWTSFAFAYILVFVGFYSMTIRDYKPTKE